MAIQQDDRLPHHRDPQQDSQRPWRGTQVTPLFGLCVVPRPVASSAAVTDAPATPMGKGRGRVEPARAAHSQIATVPGRRGRGLVPRRAVTEKLPTGESGETIAVSDIDLQAGMAIDKYQLIRELERGGMGVVFLARDTRLGRLVAIKVLHIGGDEFNKRFIAEARTTARCSHENIVVLYEADEYRGMPYMVLEYLKGQSLRQLMDEYDGASQSGSDDPQPRLMSFERAIELIWPVLKALERAHGMGIVHRDLKPANVMVTTDGKIKVLDFGIAKVLAESTGAALTDTWPGMTGSHAMSSSGILGTLPYMSPEQLEGDDVDARTDIWAVGVMLFEMVTGYHPLGPLSELQIDALADAVVDMPRVSEVRPDLGRLGRIIDRCLIRDKDDRIATARELLDELECLLPSWRQVKLDEYHSPFVGMAAFQEDDAARFFGRDADIASVVHRVRTQPLIAVLGPSGIGKSSLVRAGVIPALKRRGEGWESVVIRPGRQPLTSLVGILDRFPMSISSDDWSGQQTAPVTVARSDAGSGASAPAQIGIVASKRQRLVDEPGYLGAHLRAWAERKRRRILIFVDQFEDIYSATSNPEERAAFLACLTSLADDASSPLRVVLAMRSDYLEPMVEERSFMAAVNGGLFMLPSMLRDGLREALERPVEAVNYRYQDSRIVDSMLSELEHAPCALPLLQFATSYMWTRRNRRKRRLTRASFDEMGGIAGAMARHADAVLAQLTAPQARIARSIFERLVTPQRTRVAAGLSEIVSLSDNRDEMEYVLYALVTARLLVIQSKREATCGSDIQPRPTGCDDAAVEIAHESLISCWPTLRQWLDENKEDAEFLARLRSAARQWERSGYAPGTLWREQVARTAQLWYSCYEGPLPDLERSFVEAVIANLKSSTRSRRRLYFGLLVAMVTALLVLGASALVNSL